MCGIWEKHSESSDVLEIAVINTKKMLESAACDELNGVKRTEIYPGWYSMELE